MSLAHLSQTVDRDRRPYYYQDMPKIAYGLLLGLTVTVSTSQWPQKQP